MDKKTFSFDMYISLLHSPYVTLHLLRLVFDTTQYNLGNNEPFPP